MNTSFTQGFKDYIALDAEKKKLESELADVKERIAKAAPILIECLEANEMEKISVAGKTCYMKNTTFALIKSRQEAIDVLRASGYDDYVKDNINANSISKLVRDLIKEEGELPQAFGEVITAGYRTDLAVVSA